MERDKRAAWKYLKSKFDKCDAIGLIDMIMW